MQKKKRKKFNMKQFWRFTRIDQRHLDTLVKARQTIKAMYGDESCGSMAVGCGNCNAQILLGQLDDQIHLLKWSKKQGKKHDGTGVS